MEWKGDRATLMGWARSHPVKAAVAVAAVIALLTIVQLASHARVEAAMARYAGEPIPWGEAE